MKYTKAAFWRCALQVNPAGYMAYRGQDHGMGEEEYNQRLLGVALDNEIKIIGLADHGNIDGVEKIRSLMAQHGILVFPGFEIATTEKVHFVCLFAENTTNDRLHRYLGRLGLTDPADGVWPSDLGGNDLLSRVSELGGFAYAAHCTDGSGILRQKLNHVWINERLQAAQIPGALDELANEEGHGYLQILRNKNPDYLRERPIAILNAKDVAVPEDLANPKASCLVKMTQPCFESFRLAFQDPGSRVRLNSDVERRYFSCIESMRVTGGYLDGLEVEFSDHLNAVIGGRGTGKSTLLECIRYALDRQPIGRNAQRQHAEIVKENLGRGARVDLVVRSSAMHGRRFSLGRRYGEDVSVKDEAGQPSALSPEELLPGIEIYGQNEIYDIAQDPGSQRRLLARFLEPEASEWADAIDQALKKLADNRRRLADVLGKSAQLEDEAMRLPKLEEQLRQYRSLGLEEKLKVLPLLETERRLLVRVHQEALQLDQSFNGLRDNFPDVAFLSEHAIGVLPHAEPLRVMRAELERLVAEAEGLLGRWNEIRERSRGNLSQADAEMRSTIEKEEAALEAIFNSLPSSEGKSGAQVGAEYQALVREIERIRPMQAQADTVARLRKELEQERLAILDELSEARARRSAQFDRSLKRLNRKLKGKLRLQIDKEADRSPVIRFLQECRLDGVGEARLAWLRDADPFSPVKLAALIRQGVDALRDAGWGMTPTVAEALARLAPEQVLRLEELELSDKVAIELNIAHQGADNFKPLERLSTGQQCTAILHLLLLENRDPLVMDQPEDNLDNAFIAERIVSELRSAKIGRQFLFATHNANIPVFGDAEWIGVFDVEGGQAKMPAEYQGAIDVPQVRDRAAEILEGGRTAFFQRKAKYGF